MEALCREILAREVLSPSDIPSLQRDMLPRSLQEANTLPRSLMDSISLSSNGPSIKGLSSESPSLLSRVLHDSSCFGRMEDSDSSRRYSKLEIEELSYTNAVNPNDITKDRVRKKDSSRSHLQILHPSDRSQSGDLDFNHMDHDALHTNHSSSSFTMLDHDSNSLYSRFADDDCSNFTTPFSGSVCDPLNNENSQYKISGDSHRGAMSTDSSSSASLYKLNNGNCSFHDKGDTNTPDVSSPTNGGHGTSLDTNSLDPVFMGDVSSSSEVSFVNWQGPLEQVCHEFHGLKNEHLQD